MDISMEHTRKEIIKCIEISKHGIHAMLMVFSAASRFTREEQKTIEAIKLFFGHKILDHIILVFTHGDAVGDESTWKKILTEKSPAYLQDMLNLCENRVVLFDNKTSNVEQRVMQRQKLLDAVVFVLSRNYWKPFYFKMFPYSQEAVGTQDDTSVEYGRSAENNYEQLTQITKTVDEKLINTEDEIRRLREGLEKAQQDRDNVWKEIRSSGNLRRLDEEKRNEQNEEIRNLKEELEKARKQTTLRLEEEIRRLGESLEKATLEKENYKYETKCIVM